MFQNATKEFTFTIKDTAGVVVDLSSKTLRLVVHDSVDPPVGSFKVEGGNIDMAQAASGIIKVTVPGASAGTSSSELHYELWNITDDEVLAHGSMSIKSAKKDVP